MKWIFGQRLGKPECPYVRRWVFECRWFSLRLHHWLASDDQRHFHDHPWDYLTIVLRGGYVDVGPEGQRRLWAPTFAFYRAEHQHSVVVNPGGAWTLLITGPERRPWGFWMNGKFRKRNKYFHMMGHHPCERIGA
jgi:hypothetical protein